MELLTIETDNDLLNVRDEIKLFGLSDQLFWTSGTDLGSGGIYYWMTNGKSMGHVKWSTDRTQQHKQNCVAIYDQEIFFSNENCMSDNYFICVSKTLVKNNRDSSSTKLIFV